MTDFEVVSQNVTARMAAETLGLQVGRNGMARCPFHPDRNPCLKLSERYYCFGCHAIGDAIDFAANYLNAEKRDAAIQLAKLFNLSYDEPRCR